MTISSADDFARTLREMIGAGHFREALQRFRSAPGDAEVLRPEVQLLAATAAARLGELLPAFALAAEALERFRVRGDTDGRMRTMNLLGAINWERGELENAERCFAETLRLAYQLEDSLLAAHASNNLAMVAQLRGQPDRALGLYRRALLSYQRLGDRRGAAQTYHNLAISFRQMAEWRDAESSAVEAERHAELVGEGSLMALAIMGRAEIEIERGQLGVAEQGLDRAARLASEAGDEIGAAEVLRLQAVLALRQGDFETARREAERARALAERHEVALLRAESTAALALALKGLGRPEEAEGERQEAIRGFRALEAVRWIDRFEREWAE